MTVAPRLQGPLAEVLEAGRERFNAAFAQARHTRPRLDGAALADHLCLRVAPVVEAVARVAPQQVSETATVLYDMSLEMQGTDLLARPEVDMVWHGLLPAAAGSVAEAPRRFVAAAVNGAMQVASVGAPAAAGWVRAMQAAASRGSTTAELLAFGQVAAWRGGLAHYREGALDTADSLDPSLTAIALGLTGGDVAGHLAQMRGDRWLSSGPPASDRPMLKITARVGAFRGFGGLFRRPPTVSAVGGRLFATDGTDTWLLSADVFGATFHRVEAPQATSGGGAIILERDGTVRHGQECRAMPVLAGAHSWAATDHTLAVTISSSHQLFLVGFTRG